MSDSTAAATNLGPLHRLKRLFGVGAMATPAPMPRADGLARGFADPQDRPGTRRLVVRVDEATFARIRGLAARRDVSVSAAVRALIERGLAKNATNSTAVRVPIGNGAEQAEG